MEPQALNPKVHSPRRRRCRSQNGVQVFSSHNPLICVFVIVCFASELQQCEACECGLDASSRMYNGKPISSSTYPWMCLLLTQSGNTISQCGASLVAPQYVVTAGHCVPSSSRVTSYVVCGTSSLQTGFYSWNKVYVKTFYYVERGDRGEDIAVAKLEKKVNRMPICLPPRDNTFAGDKCKILGYGKTENGRSGANLEVGDVTIPSNSQCSRIQPVYSGEICTGNYNGAPAVCDGDSGGPLQCKDQSGRWVLAGVISATYGCSEEDAYGLSTRVSNYIDWIQEKTGNTACAK